MTRTPFDQFSKQLLETFLAPFGSVNVNREVPGESRWIDLWFEPAILPSAEAFTDLGLLGRIATTSCLIEPFRQQPPIIEVCNCKAKLFAIFAELQRQADREKRSIPDSLDGFPWLWILASSASEQFISRLGLIADEQPGIYLDQGDRTAVVAINQLPCTQDTLWIRLLGKGRTQQAAIAEILAFPAEDPRRLCVLQLLVTWKVSLEISGLVEQEEETMVQLSEAYLEWEQRTKQQGIEQGIEQGQRSLVLRLLTHQVGELSDALRSHLDQLSPTQLENLGEALLDFRTLTDLEAWFDQQTL